MKWITLNPIILLELRSAMRGRRITIVITIYVALLALLAGIIYFGIYNSHISRYSYQYNLGSNNLYSGLTTVPMAEFGPEFGKDLIVGTVLLLLVLLSFIAPAFGASAVAGEKDRQTYDTLLITTMTARQIVWGKVASILVTLLLFVALSLPIQSMAFFFGGVALPDLLIATFGLVVSVLLFSTVSLYISTLTRTATMAIIISYAILIGCICILPLLSFFTLVVMNSLFRASSMGDLTEQIILYIFWIFASFNPFGAAIISGSAIFQGEGYFFYDVNEVMSFGSGQEVWLPAPWIIYSLFSLFASRLMIILATRRVERISAV